MNAKLTKKVVTRERAETYLACADDFLQTTESQHGNVKTDQTHFWRILADYAAERCGCKVFKKGDTEPMTPDECRRFETTEVPYGVYKGQEVRDVPLNYWTYVSYGEFSKKLARYVNSETFQNMLSRSIAGAEG